MENPKEKLFEKSVSRILTRIQFGSNSVWSPARQKLHIKKKKNEEISCF
jgi:hypothetical protein